MGLANPGHISLSILVQLITGDLDEGIGGRHIIAPNYALSTMHAGLLTLGPHAVVFMATLLAVANGLLVCEDTPEEAMGLCRWGCHSMIPQACLSGFETGHSAKVSWYTSRQEMELHGTDIATSSIAKLLDTS